MFVCRGISLSEVFSIWADSTNYVHITGCESLKACGNKLPPDAYHCQAEPVFTPAQRYFGGLTTVKPRSKLEMLKHESTGFEAGGLGQYQFLS